MTLYKSNIRCNIFKQFLLLFTFFILAEKSMNKFNFFPIHLAIFVPMHIKIFILFALMAFNIVGQNKSYDKYDLHSPLGIPLVLAANFGELRSNHFHTGIDFKTNHRTGYNIYAIDDGYVSRIKVSPWGYGQVVYIDHYNGLTSVYAHCESFEGELQELARSRQEHDNHFEFDYYPAKDSLKVFKGQIIAKSGNTGGSTAPHLHFEIRETESEDALNPLLFNFDIKDTREPRIRGLKMYSLTKEGYRIPDKSKRFDTYASGSKYHISGDKITIQADYSSKEGGVGFAFDAIDQLNAANNICGIHRSYLVVDGDTVFSQDMTRISFYTNRQINTHKDYEEYHNRRKHFHKSFRTCHNELPIYRDQKNKGILNVQPGKSYNIKYSCYDTEGNRASLEFDLVINEGKQHQNTTLYASKKKLYPDAPFMSIASSHYIYFPQELLYEPTPLVLDTANSVIFGNSEVPLDNYFEIMLPTSGDDMTDKYYVEHLDNRGRSTALIGPQNDGWISVKSKEFGAFEVKVDTTGPTIENRNFRNTANVRGKTLIWNISDNDSGIDQYDLYIGGKWQLLSWEPKREAFFYSPVESIRGSKSVKIIATDLKGNKTTKEYTLNF